MNKNRPTILFQDCEIGAYIFQQNLCSAFEIVRSGDVTESFAPDAGMMKCYWSSRDYPNHSQFKPEQITADYFKHTFYGPFTKDQTDGFIKAVEPDWEGNETENN